MTVTLAERRGRAVPARYATPREASPRRTFTGSTNPNGAVGPTQILFSVNTHLRAFYKNSPHTMIWDIDQQVFWGSNADPAGVSDAHVRYDRTSQRWFITEIDVPNGNNHLLLAVSSSADLSAATWTQFAIPATGRTGAADAGCFADYDTPGLDPNAIYIGAAVAS